MNVILDANIWISFLFGKRLGSVNYILRHPDVRIYVSSHLLSEIMQVSLRPKIKEHIPQSTVELMWTLIHEQCQFIDDYPAISTTIRDEKDSYLLAMAKAIPADFIVTGDHDLLVLQKFENTNILTYSEFVQVLSSLSHPE